MALWRVFDIYKAIVFTVPERNAWKRGGERRLRRGFSHTKEPAFAGSLYIELLVLRVRPRDKRRASGHGKRESVATFAATGFGPPRRKHCTTDRPFCQARRRKLQRSLSLGTLNPRVRDRGGWRKLKRRSGAIAWDSEPASRTTKREVFSAPGRDAWNMHGSAAHIRGSES